VTEKSVGEKTMDAKQIKEYFLTKYVKVVLKDNDYIYRGYVESCDDQTLVLRDNIVGEMFVDISSIKTIELKTPKVSQ